MTTPERKTATHPKYGTVRYWRWRAEMMTLANEQGCTLREAMNGEAGVPIRALAAPAATDL